MARLALLLLALASAVPAAPANLWKTDGSAAGTLQVLVFGTDPPDTDGDGYGFGSGGVVAAGSDPLDSFSQPSSSPPQAPALPLLGALALAVLMILAARRNGLRAGREELG
jgi:hypothetical protein